jgi:hypothetical protein
MADRLLPGWTTGFYVVGSAALGEYVPGRSDLDFVATVTARLDRSGFARLRLLHILAGSEAAIRSKRQGGSLISSTPNGLFLTEADIGRPVTSIRPVASHVGYRFAKGHAFDLNPVTWKVLAESGITIRGPEPSSLGLNTEPELLKSWNLKNLHDYWLPWAKSISQRVPVSSTRLRYGLAWMVGWGTLGAPRLHYTIATGDVIGKRTAGQYALDTFDKEWRSVIQLGLDWWHDNLTAPVTTADVRRAGYFVQTVVESAGAL